MKYDEYVEKRQNLMNEVQTLIDSGNLDGADAKMKEVTALDEQWDAIAEAQANMRALSGNQRAYNVQQLAGVSVQDGVQVAKMQFGIPSNEAGEELEQLYRSDDYKNAWAKLMMGKTLSSAETDIVQKVNEYTHTTKNTGVVIPQAVASGIWDMIEELYPLWNDVQKTYVKGDYKALIGEESTDAKWYDEDTATEDGKETIGELNLSGCELSRSITVSWKLREMAIEDFIPYIQRKMARRMGAALGYGTSHGKGKPATGETFKPEPAGIITTLKKEKDTPQIVTYEKGKLSYKDLTCTRAKVKVGANELRVYANSTTIWEELANVTDEKGKPMFIPDPVNNGIYRILGMEVKEDDSMLDGEVLMSSPFVGYLANVNKDMSVMTEEHVKARTVDYCGYAIVDGGVTSTKAHALLEYAADAVESSPDEVGNQ